MVLLSGSLDAARRQKARLTELADTRLRTADSPSATLLKEAIRRSSTVRTLVADVEQSDVLVFLALANEPGKWRGDTRLASAGGGFRRLAVKINVVLDSDEQIVVFGHELQHVREVAGAPDVVDSSAMRRLFERI